VVVGPGPPSRPYVSGVVAQGWNIDCSARRWLRAASTSGLVLVSSGAGGGSGWNVVRGGGGSVRHTVGS
jgi:hypothetical protein